MLKTSMIASSKVGRGEYRISFDKDGEIIAVEIWDSSGGTISTYDCLRITH